MYPIDFFWRAAQRWPDRIAIDTPSGPIHYATLAHRVKALAAGLTALDPELQSRVAICAGNSADHITALLAILACGKVWVPLNPKSTHPEIQRIIKVTEPSIVILDASKQDLLKGAPGAWVYTSSDSDASARSLAELMHGHDDAPQPAYELPLDAIQAIKFTGGTTGASNPGQKSETVSSTKSFDVLAAALRMSAAWSDTRPNSFKDLGLLANRTSSSCRR